MEVDFNQVRTAASDDITAKLLRQKWQLDDRSSASGAVTCDAADIQRLLASEQLEPVLSVEQFLSISRGKAYGVAPRQPAPSPAQHAEPRGATDGQWEHHPDWREYESLSQEMKTAVRNDFPSYLFLKRRGALAGVAEVVGSQIEAAAAERARVDSRRAIERAVEDAATTEPDRFAAALKWAQGKKTYPALQKTKVR